MDDRSGFRLRLRNRLHAYGVLGDPRMRSDCIRLAEAIGDLAMRDAGNLAGTRTLRRALSAPRGPEYVATYRYVAGYGELMASFLAAPVGLPPLLSARISRLGALANLLVGYFDELVDGGRSRALLLPRWALALSSFRFGRALLGALARFGPAPGRLVRGLVVEYFRQVSSLPHAGRHAGVRSDLFRMIRAMYEEEARTPSEWRRLRGDPARQRKTAFPLAVLGLSAWLAKAECPPERYARHRRWLIKLGFFVRWIDDAADFGLDDAKGSANLVRRALGAGGRRRDDEHLADSIALRGRWLLDEWRMLMAPVDSARDPDAVLAVTLVSWLGEPEGVEPPIVLPRGRIPSRIS